MIGGGAAVQKPVAERWQQVTGSTITEGYGLTETSPGRLRQSGADAVERHHRPADPVDRTSIRDDAFNELPPWTGEGDIEQYTGEICVRGPQVMKGYWNSPGRDRQGACRTAGCKTGDIGHHGCRAATSRITDRKKDMILVSGFNVYPNEVESVVAMHPGVLECGVVGVPDDEVRRGGEGGDRAEGPEPDQGGGDRALPQQLTGYKVPRLVEFRDELPKTPIGKVLRRELRDPAPN